MGAHVAGRWSVVIDAVAQVRCPRCCADVVEFLAFSAGELDCWRCGRRSVPMSRDEWLSAIAGGGYDDELEAWLDERRGGPFGVADQLTEV